MRPAKILTAVLSTAIVCLSLLSCSAKNTGVSTAYTPKQIAEVIIAAQTDVPELVPLTPDDSMFTGYITGNYLMDADDLADGAVFYAFGVEASEIAVLLMRSSEDAAKATEALLDYKDRRISALIGYVPEQAALVERGVVVANGAYVALLICEDTSGAESAFFACFGSDPPQLPAGTLRAQTQPSPAEPPGNKEEPADEDDPADDETVGDIVQQDLPDPTDAPLSEYEEPADPGDTQSEEPQQTHEPKQPEDTPEADGEPEEQTATDPGDINNEEEQPQAQPEQPAEPRITEDAFDPAAIIAAWRSGDPAALTPKNRTIYDICSGVISEVITAGMTEYEKELEIHDWIVRQAEYDTEANNNSPYAKPDPDNDNPYGLLVRKKAICSGYTSTFQLFMDMLGIECITVNGFARDKNTDHAWNMVRLDGQWYCVDVTWDDPTGLYPQNHVSHMFFNVTSRQLRESWHIWDESAYPEATATDYSWETMSTAEAPG